ncbi:glycosyl hydrolase family 18 protein [Paenibacillus alvei]|uniref:glycoside hydrolase family 18 protein n=1 Tax=Paenibacillus alvei TaxID=44250 RepID=UPI0018CF0FD5|nr:glycosyl hydrolase family 18 protein [Paenibacillus alvei]MBG9733654.1 chitinase [Paenibacillus alvei]MBG9745803.1 chitinase [Paenibacillus alvei]MCY9580355.1 glycosyl hydrolase family 18 protein [Paenibacillus alvei]MCY9583319.1 glycosyl hydrolase family 18 protein [Paenibacillus alvei]
MKISIYTKLFIVALLAGMSFYAYHVSSQAEQKITSVYIPIWKDFSQIDWKDQAIDIAFIAFARIDKTNIYFHEDKAENERIKQNIVKLKEKHPQTQFVLAVGGYNADGFSDASLDGNRYSFTDSIINTVKELDLDGVDIDWEYPAFDAWGTIKARPEDTANFTSLMKDLREKLNRLPHAHKKYILTFAAGTQDWYFEKVNVKEVEKYVTYINVMSYDLTGRWSDTTDYNANLYKDARGKAKDSVHDIIERYKAHDVDSKKLLLGIPAYSYGWEKVKSEPGRNGAFSIGKPIDIDKVDLSYNTIVGKYLNKKGFKRYFDDTAKAAYLFNGDTFISYEDKEALKAKVAYIKEHGLGGAMVWEYSQDAKDGIISYLTNHLNK